MYTVAQRPAAQILFVYPRSIEAGAAFELTVRGSGFFDGLTIRFNGADHPTTFKDGALTAAISGSEVDYPGLAEVLVYDPMTNVTIGPRRLIPISLPIRVSSLITDVKRSRIYASLLGTDTTPATEIAVIEPVTGRIEQKIPVGKTPNLMVMSGDARFLYVALHGEPAIRRVDLDTYVPDLTIPLGPEGTFAASMAVMPGSPETIAVIRQTFTGTTVQPVSIYDRNVKTSKREQDRCIDIGF